MNNSQNHKLLRLGLFYLILGIIFAALVWPFGDQFISLTIFTFGMILIIIGTVKLFFYFTMIKNNIVNHTYYLIDAIFRIVFGIIIIFVPIGKISTILGVILLLYTILMVLINSQVEKFSDVLGKAIYRLVFALILIFCGIDKVGLWILRIIDLVVIIYGLILIIISYQKKAKTNVNKNVIDVEFEEKK